MTNFYVGDLIQYNRMNNKMPLYLKILEGKVGIIREVWNRQRIARIEWADIDTNTQWVSYSDMKLLNREHNIASQSRV